MLASTRLTAQHRGDEAFSQRHEILLNLPNKNKTQVLFIGDSLTRRWEDNPKLWQQYFSPYHPANLGVGGDGIEHLMWRIDHGELDGFSPKLNILLIGTNNLHKDSNDLIVKGILDLTCQIRGKNNAPVVVLGLFPRDYDENGQACLPRIKIINEQLNKDAKKHNFFYENFGDQLLTADGKIDKNIMPDGLHLNTQGYQLAGPMLVKIINKYI